MKSAAAFVIGVLLGVVLHRAGVVGWLLKVSGIRPLGRVVSLWQPSDQGVSVRRWKSSVGVRGYRALLIVGQSHAANFGELREYERDSVWVLVGGSIHRSAGPVPGAEGNRGSVWPKLAARIERQDRVPLLIIPAAIGATTVHDWSPKGALGKSLRSTTLAALDSGIEINAMLVMLGEADATSGTTSQEWEQTFKLTVRELWAGRQLPPVFVSMETRCFDVSPSETIRRAQLAVVDDSSVFRGPDLDQLGPRFRWDGCHFTSSGLDSIAMWWESLLVKNDSWSRAGREH